MLTNASQQQTVTTHSLQWLLNDWVSDVADVRVNGLQIDNRKVRQGDVFIAIPGQKTDGRKYIGQAINSGAVAVLYESEGAQVAEKNIDGVALYAIAGLQEKIGHIASRYYDDPSRALKMIGVTGTNGKTTIAYLLSQALQRLGGKSAYLGTLGKGSVDSQLNESEHTTEDAIALQNALFAFKQSGAQSVCMEVSSHGLDQARVNGIDFDIAIYTNLSRDHLDYHHTMESYAQAKQKLFEFSSLNSAVINTADAFGEQLYRFMAGKKHINVISYGGEAADIQAEDAHFDISGSTVVLRYQGSKYVVESKLLGRINVSNLLALVGCLLCLDYQMQDIVTVIKELQAVPGRMEVFQGDNDSAVVVVDYAHTPDALQRTLLSLKEVTKGQLLCVFGCGGDRDVGKRLMMGEVAEKHADKLILTDDNPRSESPQKITEKIIAGMKDRPSVIHDREQAMREAIRLTSRDDVILLAGKGHENTQTIGDQVIATSDRVIAAKLLGISQ